MKVSIVPRGKAALGYSQSLPRDVPLFTEDQLAAFDRDGFVARSKADPQSELRDPQAWGDAWDTARDAVLSGRFTGRIFKDRRWNDAAVC